MWSSRGAAVTQKGGEIYKWQAALHVTKSLYQAEAGKHAQQKTGRVFDDADERVEPFRSAEMQVVLRP